MFFFSKNELNFCIILHYIGYFFLQGAVNVIHSVTLPYPLCVCVCFVGVHQVVDVSKRISDVPEWFKGARLNYAENLLKHGDQDKVALYAASESITRDDQIWDWCKVTHDYLL